jgi:rare lipoprotein A
MRGQQVLIRGLSLIICGYLAEPSRVVSAPPAGVPNMEAIPAALPPAKPDIHEVLASWYGPGFVGRPTTSGEPFNPDRLTAASVTVPLGTVVKVENPKNGRSVKVRINDCGPFVPGRTLDLSLGAAQRIGITHEGVARLKITQIRIPRDANANRCSQ